MSPGPRAPADLDPGRSSSRAARGAAVTSCPDLSRRTPSSTVQHLCRDQGRAGVPGRRGCGRTAGRRGRCATTTSMGRGCCATPVPASRRSSGSALQRSHAPPCSRARSSAAPSPVTDVPACRGDGTCAPTRGARPPTRRSSTVRSSQLSRHRAEQAAAALSRTISVGANSMRQAPVCMKLCTPQPVSVVRSWRRSTIG